jgi:glyoxylate/succinic semialdehyde reductase|tara:strand:- start:1754 stop:2677 length:924 start_codon:yes stop_codon:yes gene_type:complete
MLAVAALASAAVTVGPTGFIGLGIMGQGMARCLLNAGLPLHVWNRSPGACEALYEESQQTPAGPSVTIAGSPAEVVRACEKTFVMLSTPDACFSVYQMDGGILSGVSEQTQIIDCATLRPEDMSTLASQVQARGGRFLEAPVSGSKVPAEQGALIFMTAGDHALFDACSTEWEAMGKDALYCGEVPAATKMKLVVNMVMGAQLAAIAEGITLAEASGLSTDDLQRVLDNGAMASPMLKLKGPNMASGKHAPNFPLKHAQKDVKFALQEAKAVKARVPVAAAANKLYERALEDGRGDEDFSAVIEALR